MSAALCRIMRTGARINPAIRETCSLAAFALISQVMGSCVFGSCCFIHSVIKSSLLHCNYRHLGFIPTLLSPVNPDLHCSIDVIKHCCVSVSIRHLSSVLRNKFDHGAESVMPTLLNLVPNSAKVMATSGMAAIRLILRLLICSGGLHVCFFPPSRRCYEFLDLMLQEWHTNTLESELLMSQDLFMNPAGAFIIRSSSRKATFHSRKLVGTRVSTTPASLQRSRSDIDVNAASSARSRLSTVPASSPFSSAAALPPGSYASLGKPSIFFPTAISDQMLGFVQNQPA
ncbi:hypothetical protein XENOCAPTIV_015322 [Xenoophorus captivus]|uniref:Uncharacterized protein n=1 Tax=Xenoophorus captivus TaxID=1517983 RepID=A0ABV0QA48_9TELE